jgi:hypothetical protein
VEFEGHGERAKRQSIAEESEKIYDDSPGFLGPETLEKCLKMDDLYITELIVLTGLRDSERVTKVVYLSRKL